MAYVDLTARFVYELQTVFGDFSKLANNDAFIKDNGWQDGTVAIFLQAAAPTGWTKQTIVDARAMRVVSGVGGGVGGSNDPGSSISLAHTHVVDNEADHTHQINSHTHHLATSGTDQASGAHTSVVVASGSTTLRFQAVGAGSVTIKKNNLNLTGTPYTTGAGGTHDHGGVTDSQLSSISLAYVNLIFCSKDTSSGYTNLTLTFVHNTRHVFDFLDQLAENDAYNYARRTPASTIGVFYSATAPVGWTRTTPNNGQLLRVVSGATGGTAGGTTDPAASISLAHTHSVTSGGAHTHTSPAHMHELEDSTVQSPAGGANYILHTITQLQETDGVTGVETFPHISQTKTDGSGTTSSNGAHIHTIDSALTSLSLAYVNVIQASKDAIGAPAAYTDMTTFFLDQALLAYQDLQSMANNDAYLYFHTMPSAAVMFFFQSSAPLNWTKVTTQNDKVVRIVSDATGGTAGGSDLLSTVTFAHVHVIEQDSHSHTFAHTHDLDNAVNNIFRGTITANRIYGAAGADMYKAAAGGAGDTALGKTSDSQSLSTDTNAHNHGGATESGLSTLSLAYADVILCSKN